MNACEYLSHFPLGFLQRESVFFPDDIIELLCIWFEDLTDGWSKYLTHNNVLITYRMVMRNMMMPDEIHCIEERYQKFNKF